MKSKLGLFLLGIPWTTITCVGVSIVGLQIGRELRASFFATTPGVIDSVTELPQRDDSSKELKVAYHYIVNAHQYSCDIAKPNSHYGSEKLLRPIASSAHPVVHYNPANPSEACLIAGVQANDLFGVMALTPLVLIMFWIWSWITAAYRKINGLQGWRISGGPKFTRLRPSRGTPVQSFGIMLGLTSFVAIFVLAILKGTDSLFAVTIVWTIIIAVSLAMAVTYWLEVLKGDRDIVFNDSERTLKLFKGSPISYDKIACIRILRERQSGRNDSFCPTVEYNEAGRLRRIELGSGASEEHEAWQFGEWFGQRLNVQTLVVDAGFTAAREQAV